MYSLIVGHRGVVTVVVIADKIVTIAHEVLGAKPTSKSRVCIVGLGYN